MIKLLDKIFRVGGGLVVLEVGKGQGLNIDKGILFL